MSNAKDVVPEPQMIGALLRYASNLVRHRLLQELNEAGFADLKLAHLAVLQHPGPDGVSPSVLAAGAGMSKQAMNQVLQSLENLEYISRTRHSDDRRMRVVRLTARGERAMANIKATLVVVEKEWTVKLGSRRFTEFKAILREIWNLSQDVES